MNEAENPQYGLRQIKFKEGDLIRRIPPPPPLAEVTKVNSDGTVEIVWPSGLKHVLVPSQLQEYEVVLPE